MLHPPQINKGKDFWRRYTQRDCCVQELWKGARQCIHILPWFPLCIFTSSLSGPLLANKPWTQPLNILLDASTYKRLFQVYTSSSLNHLASITWTAFVPHAHIWFWHECLRFANQWGRHEWLLQSSYKNDTPASQGERELRSMLRSGPTFIASSMWRYRWTCPQAITLVLFVICLSHFVW